ncbi:unnamed protein product [Amoebophrya sp. A120]|nr:unnamed protein product [Amoebophrya sp. A120]|eukprot:GSA120T00014239001.1
MEVVFMPDENLFLFPEPLNPNFNIQQMEMQTGTKFAKYRAGPGGATKKSSSISLRKLSADLVDTFDKFGPSAMDKGFLQVLDRLRTHILQNIKPLMLPVAAGGAGGASSGGTSKAASGSSFLPKKQKRGRGHSAAAAPQQFQVVQNGDQLVQYLQSLIENANDEDAYPDLEQGVLAIQRMEQQKARAVVELRMLEWMKSLELMLQLQDKENNSLSPEQIKGLQDRLKTPFIPGTTAASEDSKNDENPVVLWSDMLGGTEGLQHVEKFGFYPPSFLRQELFANFVLPEVLLGRIFTNEVKLVASKELFDSAFQNAKEFCEQQFQLIAERENTARLLQYRLATTERYIEEVREKAEQYLFVSPGSDSSSGTSSSSSPRQQQVDATRNIQISLTDPQKDHYNEQGVLIGPTVRVTETGSQQFQLDVGQLLPMNLELELRKAKVQELAEVEMNGSSTSASPSTPSSGSHSHHGVDVIQQSVQELQAAIAMTAKEILRKNEVHAKQVELQAKNRFVLLQQDLTEQELRAKEREMQEQQIRFEQEQRQIAEQTQAQLVEMQRRAQEEQQEMQRIHQEQQQRMTQQMTELANREPQVIHEQSSGGDGFLGFLGGVIGTIGSVVGTVLGRRA